MEIWVEVRRQVLAGEIGKREACREYGLHWDTLKKILAHPEPLGYRLKRPRAKPALGPFLPVIHAILEAERALAIGATTADAVRVLLEVTREIPVALFRLDGRPHLAGVTVPRPDLAAYHALREEGGA